MCLHASLHAFGAQLGVTEHEVHVGLVLDGRSRKGQELEHPPPSKVRRELIKFQKLCMYFLRKVKVLEIYLVLAFTNWF